jgi:hypothetical protein
MPFHHRHVFGNKHGNPTLISSTDTNGDDNDLFARVEAQVMRDKGSKATTSGKFI